MMGKQIISVLAVMIWMVTIEACTIKRAVTMATAAKQSPQSFRLGPC
jgi:hypothetical protein